LVVLCLVLWFLGVITTNTLGGVLHILLVVAIIFLLIHVIQGRSNRRLRLRVSQPGRAVAAV